MIVFGNMGISNLPGKTNSLLHNVYNRLLGQLIMRLESFLIYVKGTTSVLLCLPGSHSLLLHAAGYTIASFITNILKCNCFDV